MTDTKKVHRWHYDHVVDQLRYAAAEVNEHCAFRSVRIRWMLDSGDCDRELLRVIVEDLAEIRDVLKQAVAACTDQPFRYSDGSPVLAGVECGSDNGVADIDIAKPPTFGWCSRLDRRPYMIGADGDH
jgi:hypothetical protein